jgi:thiaminase
MWEIFEREYKKVQPQFKDFPWQSKEAYALWLSQIYYYVNHSSRIMALVAGRLPAQHEKIHTQVLKHAQEEAGHQFLAKQDLKNLGFDVQDFPEMNSTRMFYEPQYYKALFENALGFYGYALALEGMAVKELKEIHEKCRLLYGEKACNFIRVHAHDDVDHVEEALKMLDQLPAADQIFVEKNLSQSINAFGLMMSEIAQTATTSTSEENVAA